MVAELPASAAQPVLMTPYGQAVLIALSLGLFALVVRLLMQRRLTLGLGLFWLSALGGLCLLASSRFLLLQIASILGTLYPDAAIRLLAFVALLLVQIYVSVRLSVQEQRICELGQAVALLDHEVRSLRAAQSPKPIQSQGDLYGE